MFEILVDTCRYQDCICRRGFDKLDEYLFLIVNQYNNDTTTVILVSNEPGQNL